MENEKIIDIENYTELISNYTINKNYEKIIELHKLAMANNLPIAAQSFELKEFIRIIIKAKELKEYQFIINFYNKFQEYSNENALTNDFNDKIFEIIIESASFLKNYNYALQVYELAFNNNQVNEMIFDVAMLSAYRLRNYQYALAIAEGAVLCKKLNNIILNRILIIGKASKEYEYIFNIFENIEKEYWDCFIYSKLLEMACQSKNSDYKVDLLCRNALNENKANDYIVNKAIDITYQLKGNYGVISLYLDYLNEKPLINIYAITKTMSATIKLEYYDLTLGIYRAAFDKNLTNNYVFDKAICASSKIEDENAVFKVYQEALEKNQTSNYIFNIAIKTAYKLRDYSEVLEIYNLALEKKQLNSSIFDFALKSAYRLNRYQIAEQIRNNQNMYDNNKDKGQNK